MKAGRGWKELSYMDLPSVYHWIEQISTKQVVFVVIRTITKLRPPQSLLFFYVDKLFECFENEILILKGICMWSL